MPDEPLSQADKFRDLARELECDEDEAKFEAAVKRVATPNDASEPKADEANEAK
jgi:hypothetical protein